MTTAIAPTSANARFTYRSSGTPTIRAPSASCEIACRPRPNRVREIRSDSPAASTTPSAITNSDRAWKVAPPTETIPSLPDLWNGNGSGKTYAGRMKSTRRSASIANAIATLAATQPTVEPRTT